MQKHLCLFLFVVVSTLVRASPQTTNCIVGCKCQEDIAIPRKLKISDCDSPLALTKNAFADISKKISTIVFKHVVIKRIEKDAFNGFINLGMVFIEDSHIGSIDTSAFDLNQLDIISFTKTTFGEVPTLSASYLEELIFNDCKLSQIPNLEQLPALSFINLANNQIKDIDEMTFAKAKSLEEVTLTNNSIVKLPINLFVNNLDFTTLNLDYNPLESFQLNLNKSDLELLSLKYCKLSTFDQPSTQNLQSISYLDLSGNQLSVLPIDVFQSMKDLNYLDLSNNQLVELDDDIFANNRKLDRIILDNNQLESLPNFQTNADVFQTYHFSCKNCGLKSIDKAFEKMQGLVTIDLSDNKIEDLEEIFTKMYGLKDLNLSNNSISAIGANTFGKNTQFDVLNLSHNPLKPLDPVVFANIKSLNELHISNCSLIQLWANHNAILPSLEKLYAGGNNITVVSIEDLKVTPKLRLLDLQNNPLECTPELNKFVKYVLEKQIHPIERENIFKTHEALHANLENDDLEQESAWKKLAVVCNMDSIFYDDFDDDDDEDDEDEDEDINNNISYKTEKVLTYDDLDDPLVEDEGYYDDETNGKENGDDVYLVGAKILNDRNFTLARASYILSITSVFILTALVVLTVAVAITLLILKKNKSFNMHNGNLPRLKIPLWHTTPGHKKHSGSVYKPLSEDLSGPRTPIINRYEFKQTPQVHNTIP